MHTKLISFSIWFWSRIKQNLFSTFMFMLSPNLQFGQSQACACTNLGSPVWATISIIMQNSQFQLQVRVCLISVRVSLQKVPNLLCFSHSKIGEPFFLDGIYTNYKRWLRHAYLFKINIWAWIQIKLLLFRLKTEWNRISQVSLSILIFRYEESTYTLVGLSSLIS